MENPQPEQEVVDTQRSPLEQEVVNTLRADYTDYYRWHKDDSPLQARQKLIDSLIKFFDKQPESSEEKKAGFNILDLGGGPQKLEEELKEKLGRDSELLELVQIVNIDIARFGKDQLLSPETTHQIQGEGDHLPFANRTFHIVVSSMAIDLMPRSTFEEVRRVLKDSGWLLATFHHLKLVEIARKMNWKLHGAIRKKERKRAGRKLSLEEEKKLSSLRRQWEDTEFVMNYYPKILFRNPDEIKKFLEGIGFDNVFVEEEEEKKGSNKWYVVNAQKSQSLKNSGSRVLESS